MLAEGIEFAPDSTREVKVYLHKTASPYEVLVGTATGAVELTRYASQVRQSTHELSLTLTWHDELGGDDQPTFGQVLEVELNGVQHWIGIIQAVNDYRLAHGEKQLSVTARSRDATPAWRDTRRATDIYPTATPLGYIARQIALSCGLVDAELLLQDTGATTVHSNTQLADLTPWQMLTTLYQPSGLEPYVDALGRLKCISRELTRASDVVLSDNRRLVSVDGSKTRPPITEMRIKWLDPNLTEVAQQSKKLAGATLTAGFFQLKQEQNIQFSPDETQRARDSYLIIKQSANSGLLPVCSENYEQIAPTGGRITLRTSAWVPALATAAMATKFAAHQTPDSVTVPSTPVTVPTVPAGRRLEFVADAVILLTMMSIGTGVYEVWGTPYDYVHARNTTTAYNSAASVWAIKYEEIENDFVTNDDQAQSFAVRELSYAYRSASSYNITIVDDTRIERGDIVELSDGSRVYVTGYSRDLSFGASALLSVQGFRI